jgi:hypothetical protein
MAQRTRPRPGGLGEGAQAFIPRRRPNNPKLAGPIRYNELRDLSGGGLDARRVLGDREKGEDHLTARAHTGAREHARGLPMGVVDASARGG